LTHEDDACFCLVYLNGIFAYSLIKGTPTKGGGFGMNHSVFFRSFSSWKCDCDCQPKSNKPEGSRWLDCIEKILLCTYILFLFFVDQRPVFFTFIFNTHNQVVGHVYFCWLLWSFLREYSLLFWRCPDFCSLETRW